jgi:GrpB-like predicted nucleotidyltransferase (UPF0157 family)
MRGERLHFRPAQEVPGIGEAFRSERERILALLPDAEVVHTGASSVPRALTRGDLDIQVRVPPSRFDGALGTLDAVYARYRPDIWSHGFAAFVAEAAVPTGLVLTAIGAEHDRLFTRSWEQLRREPEFLQALNELKLGWEGSEDDGGYEEAKAAFFAAL